MAESILGQIANPPGINMPERLSDLATARQQRETQQAATEAQNLQNARTRLQEVGRSAKALLDTYYPEGQEQPTNPAQAAKDYFKVRDRLVNQMGVPEDAVPNRIPRRSELQQAFEQAQTLEQQMASEPQPAAQQFRMGNKLMQRLPDGTVEEVTEFEQPEPTEPQATDTYLNKDTGQEETLVRTNRGLARQTVNEQGQVVYEPVNSAQYTKIDRRRVTTEQIGGTERAGGDLTVGDVVPNVGTGDFPMPDPKLTAGPIDRFLAVSTRIPIFNEVMQSITQNPDAGIPQRTATRLGDELENQTIMAFKPSDDDKTSNLQIELARKLSPKMGFFTTDESVMTDLQVLHERTMSKLNKKLRIANNEKFPESTRKDASERAIQLGNLVSLTGPLLQAAKDPVFPVENMLGKPISEADPKQVWQTVGRLPQQQRQRFFSGLEEDEANRLGEAWKELKERDELNGG